MSNYDSSDIQNSPEKSIKPINSLCFMGGGAKGYVYPGTYKALDEAGIMDNVNLISGASVGAITSCFIACGMSPDDLFDRLSKADFKKLLGNNFVPIQQDGKGLRGLLSDIVRQEFKKTFDNAEVNLAVLSDDEQNAFNDLKSKAVDYQFTMADLALLRKIDPIKYKDLLVTAVHTNSESLHIFTSVEQTKLIKDWLRNKKEFNELIKNSQEENYQFKAEDLELIKKIIDSNEINNKYKTEFQNLIKKIIDSNDNINQEFNVQIKQIFSAIQQSRTDSPDFTKLINRSQEENYQFKKEDLDLIKKNDPTKDFKLMTNQDGQNEIFSNIGIVDACMASAALPFVLKNVEINEEKFMDGGVLENIPFNILDREDNCLILGFNGKSLHNTLYTGNQKPLQNDIVRTIVEFILSLMGYLVKQSVETAKNKSLLKVRNNAAHYVIPNEIKDIDTTDFTKVNTLKVEGLLRGYFSTMNHLILYNTHPKAVEILKKEDALLKLQKDNPEDLKPINELNAEIQKLADDFAIFRQKFEIRKFIFEVIDNIKNRKSDFYKELLEFCHNKGNFTGDINKIAENCLLKFSNHNRTEILKKALNNEGLSPKKQPWQSIIASDEIRNVFNAIDKNLWIEKRKTIKKWKEQMSDTTINRGMVSII